MSAAAVASVRRDVTAEYLANIARIKNLIDSGWPLTPEDHKTYGYFLLAEWQETEAVLARAKATEMDYRKQFVAFMSDPKKNKGTEYVQLDNGYRAKIVKKLNYGFVKDEASGKVNKAAIDAALTAIESMHPAGAYIAENLVKWTPELSLTEYNKLTDQLAPLKAVIDKVIVTTDGAPTLDIVEPKGK